MYCLQNVLIEFNGEFFVQDQGIVTGENYSVPLANITLHYVIKSIGEINKFCHIFKRYIDDVIFITNERSEGEIIKSKLS